LTPSLPGAVAGLDPGRSKCGLVLSDPGRRRIVEARVLPPQEALACLQRWRAEGLTLVVLGNGTGHRDWRSRLGADLPVAVVEESHTTLAARSRYWELEPPRGWRRLLPEGLRQPPRDWDDVVAQLLVERWLGHPLERGPIGAITPLRRPPAP
jgi:hypothetical protein